MYLPGVLFCLLICLKNSANAVAATSNEEKANQLIEMARQPSKGSEQQLLLFKRALEYEPNNLRALYNAAMLSTNHAPGDAMSYYEKLLALDTNDFQARVNIIKIYAKDNLVDAAYHIRWHIKQLKYWVNKKENNDKTYLIASNGFNKLLEKVKKYISAHNDNSAADKFHPYPDIARVLKTSSVNLQTRGRSGFGARREALIIKFMESSYSLTKRAKKKLNEFIRAFEKGLLEDEMFLFRGYVNEHEANSPEEKELLGLKRAIEVKNYITQKSNFKPSRIATESLSDRYSSVNKSAASTGRNAGVSIHYVSDGNSPVSSNLN